MLKKTIGQVHKKLVFNRRVSVLAQEIGAMLPPGSHMLDVGTGDGQIAKLIADQQDEIQVQGIDITKRQVTHIPITLFDGIKIPMDNKSVDVVTFVDVLHHTKDPQILINEASRVARKIVIIKDHLSENVFDHCTLRLMDWVGNAPHGVLLPYNYAPRKDWDLWFANARLSNQFFQTTIPLYPPPLSWVFGRKLHFIAQLTPQTT